MEREGCKSFRIVVWFEGLGRVLMAKADTKSIFDRPADAVAEARLDAEAEADCAAGRVVPHERVREWLAKLARGERVPPPEA